MSKICGKCGAENADEAVFCCECGAKIEEAAPAVSAPDAPSLTLEVQSVKTDSNPGYTTQSNQIGAAPVYPQASSYNNSGYAQQSAAPQPAAPQPVYQNPKETKVAKTAAFFWLDFLYALPGIGFIACIVIAAAATNLNIKHHACAKLIWTIVGVVLGIVLSVLALTVFRSAIREILNSGYSSYFYGF